jgi:hypothetical protein
MLGLYKVVLSTVHICLLFIPELKGVKGRSESPRESGIRHLSRRPWGISAEPPRSSSPRFATQHLTDKLRDGLKTCESSLPSWRKAMRPALNASEGSGGGIPRCPGHARISYFGRAAM